MQRFWDYQNFTERDDIRKSVHPKEIFVLNFSNSHTNPWVLFYTEVSN